MSARIPLYRRPGLKTQNRSRLGADLSALMKKHGFCGAVLIAFDAERVHAVPCGMEGLMLREMQTLSERILAAIDDGFFDPAAPDQFPQRTQ